MLRSSDEHDRGRERRVTDEKDEQSDMSSAGLAHAGALIRADQRAGGRYI